MHVVEDDSGVFPAELEADGGEGFGCGGADGVGDGAGADESEVADGWVGGKVVGGFGPAGQRLDEVGAVATGGEGAAGNGAEVGG